MAPGPRARPKRSKAARAIRTVRAVVNPASGSVGPGAAAELADMLKSRKLEAEVVELTPGGVDDAIAEAVAAAPDAVLVLAGDGTARMAAQACGPDGPLVMPLAGGTMNMLPYALYGRRPWKEGLEAALESGEIVEVAGGDVDGHRFHVAAILGAPAMWAYAREAARGGEITEALEKARAAWEKAFSSRLRFRAPGLDEAIKTEALALMCPLVSRAMDDQTALEALVLDPKGTADALRLGVRTLFADFLGDWRQDPAVSVHHVRRAEAWARGRIPAILDGEPMKLPRKVEVTFQRVAFRALAALPPAEEPAA